MRELLSVDIGSTMTKGALFSHENGRLRLLKRAEAPTSRRNIREGYYCVREELSGSCLQKPEVHITSSAHGGMNIYALGLVPALTAGMARRTALGAGGWISGTSSYELDETELEKIQEAGADIILFSGGTEGGNKKVVLKNAEMLSSLKSGAVILYAGNSRITGEIRKILKSAHLVTAPNIMPEINKAEPEGAQEAIRRIFLEKIIRGKGLEELVRTEKTQPVPTPGAMLSLVNAVYRQRGSSFCLLDPGGATTDVYTALKHPSPQGAVIKGLPEPPVRRTVEGDLGLRISARQTAGLNPEDTNLEAYSRRVSETPELLPETEADRAHDRTLAELCIRESLKRHAGRIMTVRTLDGMQTVAEGRDLRQAETLIYTGGYPSRHEINYTPSESVDNEGNLICTPRTTSQARDCDYVWPLLAGLAGTYPEEAARTAWDSLKTEVRKS